MWLEYKSEEFRDCSSEDENEVMRSQDDATGGQRPRRLAAADIDISDARFVYADKMDQMRETRRNQARQKREQKELQRRMSQHRRMTHRFGNYGRLPFNYGILYPPRGLGGLGVLDEI